MDVDELKARVIYNARRKMSEIGIPQRTLALRAGVPWGSFRRALSARDRGMATGSILLLARALDVDPSYLCAPIS